MKRRMKTSMMFLVTLLALSIGAQGAIQVPSIVNGTATKPVLKNTGNLLEAIDFGVTTDTPLDGITFDGWSPAASGAVYTGTNLTVTVTNGAGIAFSTFTGLDGALPASPVWNSENYVGNTSGPITTVISGLSAARSYRIQYMNYEARGYVYSTEVVTLQDSTGASAAVDYNFGSSADPFAILNATVSGATSFTIIMPASPSGKSCQLDGLTIHDITGFAYNPNPADGQGLAQNPSDILFPKVDITQNLSWTGPASSAIDSGYAINYRLYADPNQTKVQTGAADCGYLRDFATTTLFDPATNMADGATYYWRIDVRLKFVGKTDPNTLTGDIWIFKTKPLNNPVMVDAGPSLVTWLAKSQAGIVLDQSALIYPVEGDESFVWSAVWGITPGMESPSSLVSFDNPAILHPTVIITKVGTYTIKCVGKDGVNPEQSDLMQIRVYADACEAAKNNPVTPYVRLTYDFDNDCIENLDDFAMLATKWLEHNYAENNIFYNTTITENDLALWLDASDTATLTIDGSNGVSRWNDKSGNGYYLVTGGTTAGNPLYVSAALNGKAIIDFGAAFANATGGKWMQFKKTDGTNLDISNIRTVFWVMKGANFLLGDDNQYHFHRAASEIVADSNIWSSGNASAYVRNGKTYLNGAVIDGTTTKLPVVYSQISLVTTGNVEASRLCNDRTLRTGGQQIAEILIFNRALNDAERLTVEQYLKGKWGTP